MQTMFLVLLFVMGSVFGSFLCCQVRRAKARRKNSKKYPARSICLHCKKQLKWHDNIPIISWIFLKGKCRFCHKEIGTAEVISEFLMALAFLGFGVHFLQTNGDFFGIGIISWLGLGLSLILLAGLGFLAIYDGLYGELPGVALTFSVICAIIMLILQIGEFFLVTGFFDWQILLERFVLPSLLGAALYGGIYLILYIVSKGKWVGDGDWILAAIIGLALGDAWLALVALFMANLIACAIMYPMVRKSKKHQIYFGPFMVVAFVIVYVFSPILSLY